MLRPARVSLTSPPRVMRVGSRRAGRPGPVRLDCSPQPGEARSPAARAMIDAPHRRCVIRVVGTRPIRTRGRSAVAIDTLLVVVGVYGSVDDAKADYELVGDLHTEAGLIDAYDAAVIERTDKGKTKIVKKHETPTRVGGVLGGGMGLATGLVVALFPFAAVGGGLLVGTTAGGAILGAVAGHAAAGMSRHDLKELGEQLDEGDGRPRRRRRLRHGREGRAGDGASREDPAEAARGRRLGDRGGCLRDRAGRRRPVAPAITAQRSGDLLHIRRARRVDGLVPAVLLSSTSRARSSTSSTGPSA